MLRSSRIPTLLNRICTDGIVSSYLITIDGELLGCSNIQPHSTSSSSNPKNTSPISPEDSEDPRSTWENMDPSDIGALVAEVVEDYKRLGLELALLNPPNTNVDKQSNASGVVGNTGSGGNGKEGNIADGKDKERGKLNCLIVEMEKGLVGIAAATSNTYVVGLADSSAQHGFLKMKLTSLSAYVRDAFLPLEKGSI